MIALAFVAFAAAESVGGNGIIAAFVGGLVEGAEIPGAERIVATAVRAVIASTVLHGVTAYPPSIAYGRWAEATTAEQRPVSAMPTRVSMAPLQPPPAAPPD